MTSPTMKRLLATLTDIHMYDDEQEILTRTLECVYDTTTRLVTAFVLTCTFTDGNDWRRAETWSYEIDREQVSEFIATCRRSANGIIAA